jgi:hypothetical protein
MFGARRTRALHLTGLCLLLAGLGLSMAQLASARTPAAMSAAPVGPSPLRPPGQTVDAPTVDARTDAPTVDARTDAPTVDARTDAPTVDARTDAPAALHDVRVASNGLRVLLIGNSYTMHHTLHLMLQRVAAGVSGGPQLVVDAEAHGGYSLHNHLRTGQALARIRSGHYTHVVLQGHSMSALDHPDQLSADAERFKQAIDGAAARTVFYATWARSPEARMYLSNKLVHSFEEMTDRVDAAYLGLSRRLGAGIAPVGRAFQHALVQEPKLALWGSDGSHPTVAGSYMAACVLYGALTGADPRASAYVPAELSEHDAALIRGIAAQSLSEGRSLPLLSASASLL